MQKPTEMKNSKSPMRKANDDHLNFEIYDDAIVLGVIVVAFIVVTVVLATQSHMTAWPL